jgi:hypothetical protein
MLARKNGRTCHGRFSIGGDRDATCPQSNDFDSIARSLRR